MSFELGNLADRNISMSADACRTNNSHNTKRMSPVALNATTPVPRSANIADVQLRPWASVDALTVSSKVKYRNGGGSELGCDSTLCKKAKRHSVRDFLFGSRSKKRDKENASKTYLDDKYTTETITDEDLDKLVRLPYCLDKNEWLATVTISFFEYTNLLFGTISEYCTPKTCPSMIIPNNVQLPWVDEKGRKMKCSAPHYIDMVMINVQKTIHDQSVFPTKYGQTFPGTFELTIKKIQRLLYHTLAHIYHCHFKQIAALRLYGHLNTLLLHLLTFGRYFQLLSDKDTEGLNDLFQKLVRRSRATQELRSAITSSGSQYPGDALYRLSSGNGTTGGRLMTLDIREANGQGLPRNGHSMKQEISLMPSYKVHYDSRKSIDK